MKVAIIGAGAIARRAHLPAWKGLPGVELACIVDVDEENAKKVAQEFQVESHTDKIQTVLNDASIDILDICSPTPTHHNILLDCIDSGKHIICEKPLTDSLEKSIDIYEKLKTKTNRAKLSLIYNWRYQDNIRQSLIRRLQIKPFGELITVHGIAFSRIPVGWTPNMWLYNKAAVLYDFTPHLIDAVQWLVDKPVESVYAYAREFTENAKFLSSAQLVVKYENGPTAFLDTSWDINSNQFNIDLYGDCAHLHIDLKRDRFSEFHGGLTLLDEIREFSRKMKNVATGIINKNISTMSAAT